MVNTSNLYAEKIYAEHPIALWSLDDNANYVKIMPDDYLNLASATVGMFTLSNISSRTNITSFTDYSSPPISSAITTKLVLTSPSVSPTTASIAHTTGSYIPSTTNAFTISFHYYATNPYLTSIKVGYKVGGVIQSSQTYTVSQINAWQFISQTFTNSASQTVQLFIEFSYNVNPNIASDTYEVLINGFTVGYSSEDFNKYSVGISQNNYSTNVYSTVNGITGTRTYGYVVDAYGTSDTSNNGYYLIRGQATSQNGAKLLAKNAQIPMVYGSSNSTIVYPNPSTTDPSLILPAQGFLNEYGKNNQYTFEFWLRLRAIANGSIHRIFGPVNSTDGIYLDKTAIVLKIGNKTGSHYIGEWYRPMLLDIRYSPTEASLLINGELAVSLQLDSSDISLFPLQNSGGKSNDWVGFYANSSNNVPSLEIDCVAIYPYIVDSGLAKRRFVFGQGVEYPRNIDLAYKGKSYLVDFSVADYANNIKYPNTKKWTFGLNNNFDVSNSTLATPKFSLPLAKFSDSTLSLNSWYTAQSTTASFNLNAVLTYNGYLYYESMLDILNGESISGFILPLVAPASYASSQNQTIIKIVNKNTGNYISVSLVPDVGLASATLQYLYKIGSASETVIDSALTTSVASSAVFTAGINIQTLLQSYQYILGSEFNNQSNLKVYIGNDELFASPFTGNFKTIGFMNGYNLQSFISTYSSYFGNTGGIGNTTTINTNTTSWNYTYKLSLINPLGIASAYSFDIGTSSSWQDYVPLQTLATYTSSGTYDIDFLQFNIDYPEPCVFSGSNYDTAASDVKTYVYFRYLSSGSYVDPATLTAVSLPSSGVVAPLSVWKTRKYEVVNGTIIYPPTVLDANTTISDLVISIIVESKNTRSIISPISIRSVEITSKTFDTETSKFKNGFSTKLGNTIYPYTHRTADASTVFNYKDKNPYKIYKSDLPYLYMTRNSGISVMSGYSNGVSDSRGIMIPINEKAETPYSLNAMQMFVRYEAATFPATETKIFSIVTAAATIDFYMIATTSSATRARIYAKNGSNEYTNIKYYLNGVNVMYPVIAIGEWSSLGLQFTNNIVLDAETADLRFTGSLMFNNLSYYHIGSSNIVKYSQQRWSYYTHSTWTNVYNANANTWNTILSATITENIGVNPDEVYNSLIGTNKDIIDNSYLGEDALSIKNPSRKLVTSSQWQTSINDAV